MPAERVTDIEQSPRMSLWDIEADWLVLIQARAEAEELPEPKERELAILACDCAIREYTERELAKVDGIRAVVRTLKSAMEAAKQERDYQAKRAASCDGMIARIKDFVKTAMEAAGKKRIDGRTGYLALKGNGGLEPLVITDVDQIPANLCRMEGWIMADLLELALDMVRELSVRGTRINDYSLRRVPDNEAIRAALAEPCAACKGAGERGPDGMRGLVEACQDCGGTGKAAVPGAHLEPRGAHVEIR